MNKICTSLEQSKRLIELGFDIDTADMYYQKVLPKSEKIEHNPKVGNPLESLEWYNKGYTFRGRKEPITLNEHCIPAWSLTALLSIIKPVNDNTYTLNGTLDGGAMISFDEVTNVIFQEEGIIDAVFQMVVWLKENGKI